MLFRRFKTAGLAHNAYVLGCGAGEAVIVDPRRDVEEYLAAATRAGLTVRYVLQTHRQEDFEHGAGSLAQLTGAKIVSGDHALSGRSDMRLAHKGELTVGETRFVALHTPGHTPESVCYAVYRKDAGDRCWALFSGDALFVGATGRTDLADPARTAENAGLLYDALRASVAPLGDQVLLYPAHGSGSACGGNIAERDDSTLGIENGTNPVFTMTREQFVAHKLAEKLPRPPYLRHMEAVNLSGGRALPSPQRVRSLPPREFADAAKAGIVVDTRAVDGFAADTAVLSLARVGIDAVHAVLAGGIAAWREAGQPIARIGTTGAHEAAQWHGKKQAVILDVRDDHEFAAGHIAGARHVYVGHLEETLPSLQWPSDQRIVVHCSVGNRSGLAASILRRHGIANVFNMLGGFKAWRNAGLPVEKPRAKA